MPLALATVGGLVAGSFLNVVIVRLPDRRSLLRPRSHCPGCGTPVKPYDNVPLLSWLLLRGRCRSCGERISARYPLVELGTAALCALVIVAKGTDWDAWLGIAMVLTLVPVAFIDLEHRIIPNRIVVPAAAVVLVAQTAIHPSPEWAIAAFGASGFLFVTAVVYPAGMGMGDVKLALLLGAMLGWDVSVALMVGFVAALVPAAVLALRHGSKARKMAIPFAPFLAFGAVVALFFGDAILHWYLGIFG
jgi:leader peptidase (prepilin peptidase) / N-methyltransferase